MIESRFGMEQEKRVARAIAEGPDMQWRKAPNGWVVETPSGGCYQVWINSCSCPDHKYRCAGTEMRCAHVVELNRKLAFEERRPSPIADAVNGCEETARRAAWDRIMDGA